MVDSEDESSELLALASRFGGSRVALLAAKQALRSRQASAEASRADVGSSDEQHAPTQPPSSTRQLNTGDDEALALRALLNRPGRGEPGLQLRRPSRPLSEPERSSAAAQDNRGRWEGGNEPAAAPSLPDSPQLSGGRSFEDAAMDTVLTGSPVGGSPEASRSSIMEDCSPADELSEEGCSAAKAAPPSPRCLASPQPPALQPPLPARRPSPPRQPHACPARTAVQQRVWSFDTIPQGTVSIPSTRVGGGGEQHPAPRAVSAAGNRRPAFYTRAASPPPRPLSAVPAPVEPAPAATAAQLRQQRLEQLARPKHAAPRAWRRQQQPPPPQQQQGPQELLGDTAAGDGGSSRPAVAPKKPKDACAAAQAKAAVPAVRLLASAAAATSPKDTIPAWRPGSSAAAAIAGHQQQHQQQPRRSSRSTAASAGSTATRWPQQLGREPDAAELQRATGAYSAERFERNLGALSALLARRQHARASAADAAEAGVDSFVAGVRQVQTPSSAGGTCDHAGVAAGTGTAAGQRLAELEHAEDEQPCCTSPAGRDEEEHHSCSVAPAAAVAQPVYEEALPHSPTERLLRSCERLRQQRQQQRPETAPHASLAADPVSPLHRLQRPTTGSPGGVKSLMQVKREQDRALQELQQQARPFKASPLPLSTMEPRYQRQDEEREALRAAALEARRQQLLAEQRPFGFDAREAELLERRRLVHGDDGAAAAAARPATPTVPFHAQPVPVSTAEARYALLVAEMQLQNRSVRGRGLASPPRRPATGAAASPARQASPSRRSATATARSWQAGEQERQRPATAPSAHERVHRWEALAAARSSAAARFSHAATAVEAGLPLALECSKAEQQGAAPETLQHTLPAGAPSAAAELPPDTMSAAAPVEAVAPAPAAEPAPIAAAPATSAVPSPAAPAAPAAHAQPEQPAAARQPEQRLQRTSSSPATQRLGSRGPSTDGAAELPPSWASRPPRPPSARLPGAAPLPTGIAVPVCSLTDCRQAMAAGAGAELLPALARRATTEGAPHPGSPPMQPGSPARRTGEERRDTPPQHIAARHRQAEAAVRAEVAALLRKRGGGAVALMGQRSEELAW